MEEIVAASNQLQVPQTPKLDSQLENPATPISGIAAEHEGRDSPQIMASQHQKTVVDAYPSEAKRAFGPGTAAVELLALPQAAGLSPKGDLITEIRAIAVL